MIRLDEENKCFAFNIEKARDLMNSRDVDALIACTPENIFYSSGLPTTFTATNLSFLVGKAHIFSIIPRADDPVLIVTKAFGDASRRYSWIGDQRIYTTMHATHIERQLANTEELKIYTEDCFDAARSVLKEKGIAGGNIGVEGMIPLCIYKNLKKAVPNARFLDSTAIFTELRMIKSREEIKRIAKATEITEKAMMSAIDIAEEGVSEIDLSNTIKATILEEGGSWYQTSCCAGANAAILGALPSKYRIRKGDTIRMDIGGVYRGYSSDLSRTAVVGEPKERVTKLYDALCEGQRRAIEAIKPGIKLSEVFQIGQETVREMGYPRYTRGFIGHSIGIELEEDPFISPESNLEFKYNMVLAVELPYYIVGCSGFNIEDLVVVKENGHEVLSHINRDLQVV